MRVTAISDTPSTNGSEPVPYFSSGPIDLTSPTLLLPMFYSIYTPPQSRVPKRLDLK